MTQVKICGITNLEDALAAVEAGAEMLGFNFYRRSPRYIEPPAARRLVEQLPPGVLSVGVFVNEGRPEEVLRLASEAGVGAVLLDAYVPGEWGGTGRTFDWGLARRARELAARLILAGGLTPGNVAAAVRAVGPFAVDACSGVEVAPGRKSPDLIRRFVETARGA